MPRHLTYPAVTVHALLERTARERPNTVATIFGGAVASRCIDAQMSYRQLDALADRFAAGLQASRCARATGSRSCFRTARSSSTASTAR